MDSKNTTILTFVAIICLLAGLPLAVHGQNQDLERVLTQSPQSCEPFEIEASFSIPELYRKGKTDSIRTILQTWEKRCISSEPLRRISILLSIEQSRFSPFDYDENILDYVTAYKEGSKPDRLWTVREIESNYKNAYLFFEDFTRELAVSLKQKGFTTGVEGFFTTLYTGDVKSAVNLLETGMLHGTKLQQYYDAENIALHRRHKQIYGYGVAGWFAGGNLKPLGPAPGIRAHLGGTFKSFTYRFFSDIFIGLREPSHIQLMHEDSLVSATGFIGINPGIELQYDFWERGRSKKLALTGGASYAAFILGNVQDPDDDNGNINLRADSWAAFLGMEYKIYSVKMNYFALGVKYNLVDISNPGGTDLNGNFATVIVSYNMVNSGGSNNVERLHSR